MQAHGRQAASKSIAIIGIAAVAATLLTNLYNRSTQSKTTTHNKKFRHRAYQALYTLCISNHETHAAAAIARENPDLKIQQNPSSASACSDCTAAVTNAAAAAAASSAHTQPQLSRSPGCVTSAHEVDALVKQNVQTQTWMEKKRGCLCQSTPGFSA